MGLKIVLSIKTFEKLPVSLKEACLILKPTFNKTEINGLDFIYFKICWYNLVRILGTVVIKVGLSMAKSSPIYRTV